MKQLITICLTVVLLVSCSAQKLTKIKGNREVTDVYNSLEGFDGIDVYGDFKVTLKRGDKNSYHLKADENLVPVIAIEVVKGILQIKPTHNIQSSKKLEVDITYTTLNEISIRDNVTLMSMNKIDLADLKFSAFDNSNYKLDMNVADGIFLLNNNSKGDLKMKGGSQKMIFNDNAYVKGDFNLLNLEVEINSRADVSLKGNVDAMKLTATGTSDVKAKDFESEFADIIASGKADIYVHASKELKLYAQGKSFIYVYGNPEIKVEGLNDKSQIIKK